MAVSKKAEKERLKKERIKKVGNELLNKSLNTSSMKSEIQSARKPRMADLKMYEPYKGMSDREVAKDIISSRNRSLKDGNATKRMENDTTSMGYKTIEKKWYEKPLIWKSIPNLDSGNERRLKGMYGNVEGQKKINEINKKRQESNFNAKYKRVLKNEWENPMYGISEKDKQKMMKKKGKR